MSVTTIKKDLLSPEEITITIKTGFDYKGSQYWFAVNQDNATFGLWLKYPAFYYDLLFVKWQFNCLGDLQNYLSRYRKSLVKTQDVETFKLQTLTN